MTEETKHTLGPWHIDGGKPRKLHFDKDTRFWIILDKDGYSPAIVPPWDAVPPIAAEEAKANARLIAAAPELLEALEGLWMWCRNWDCEFMDDDEFPEYRARIEAAIAKAKGEA